jgi:hypothetical protein
LSADALLPQRYRWVAVCALYGILSIVFCLPLFDQPQALGTNDWDQHLFYYGSVLKNIVEYRQMPFWNPWYCGGNVMWQNPQIAVLSPVYLLSMLMSLPLAMKVNIVLHYWIGFIGMHVLLTRAIGVTFLPAVIYLATLVTASGAPAIHLRVGHSVFLPGFYLPFQLYFFFKALKTGEWKFVFLSAATLALMVFNGGTHILPMSIASIGCFALVAAIARGNWRPLAFAAAFGIAGLGLASPKLLPVVQYVNGEYFWDTRNPTEQPDRVTLDILEQTYLVPTEDVRERLPMQRHGWHEYGNYIGIASALALVAGVIWVLARRSPRDHWFGVALAATTIAMFALSLGEFSAYAPASLAHHLPLFSSFRIPSRYTIPFVQFGALTLGFAYSTIEHRYRPGAVQRIVIGAAAIAVAAQLIVTNRWNLKDVFTLAPFDTTFSWSGGPRQIGVEAEASPYTPDSPMLRALMADRSFFSCYESLQVARGAVANRPVVFDANEPSRVTDVEFTPNQLTFNVTVGPTAAVAVLNQNWAPGWTSSAGPIESPPRTELGRTTIPPGQSGRYTFRFVPPGFYAGLVLFGLTMVGGAVLWRRRLSPIFEVPRPQ